MNASLPEGKYLYLQFSFTDKQSRNAAPEKKNARYALPDLDGQLTEKVTALLERFSGKEVSPRFPFALFVPHNTRSLQAGLKSLFAPMTTYSSASQVAALVADIVTFPFRLIALLPRLIYQRCSQPEGPMNREKLAEKLLELGPYEYDNNLQSYSSDFVDIDTQCKREGVIYISKELKSHDDKQLNGALQRQIGKDFTLDERHCFEAPKKSKG